MKNFEKELIKTPININFTDDPAIYTCFYNPSNEKTYYKVNDEFLMIVDALKVKEVKNWFNTTKKIKNNQEEEE